MGIPRGPWGWAMSGPSFEPVCEESAACKGAHNKKPPCLGPEKPCACKCSGDGIGDLPQLEIVDKVQIPADLKPGSYVLGWRWDCEECGPRALTSLSRTRSSSNTTTAAEWRAWDA